MLAGNQPERADTANDLASRSRPHGSEIETHRQDTVVMSALLDVERRGWNRNRDLSR